MDRRTFSAAPVALGGSTAAEAQDATPLPDEYDDAVALLGRYLGEVINSGHFQLIYDLFDPDYFDLDVLILEHLKERERLLSLDVSPGSSLIESWVLNSYEAIAHGTRRLEPGDEWHLMYWVTAYAGKISGFHWVASPEMSSFAAES